MSVNKKSCRGCNTKKNLKKKKCKICLAIILEWEIRCAIAFNQIKKLKKFVNKRNKLALNSLKN